MFNLHKNRFPASPCYNGDQMSTFNVDRHGVWWYFYRKVSRLCRYYIRRCTLDLHLLSPTMQLMHLGLSVWSLHGCSAHSDCPCQKLTETFQRRGGTRRAGWLTVSKCWSCFLLLHLEASCQDALGSLAGNRYLIRPNWSAGCEAEARCCGRFRVHLWYVVVFF